MGAFLTTAAVRRFTRSVCPNDDTTSGRGEAVALRDLHCVRQFAAP
jgi:hypothetical protein